MSRIIIPTLTDEELIRRYEKIKPIVEYQGKNYEYRKLTIEEIKTLGYTLEVHYQTDLKDMIPKNNLIFFEKDDIECYHLRGTLKILFRPTIAEILSQIPDKIIEKYDYFKIIECLGTRGKYHISKIRFFKT